MKYGLVVNLEKWGRGEGGTLAISVVFYLKVRDLKHKGQNIDTCLTLVLDI